ncbi:MAG: NAD(P)H-hydrate dehydratase [Ancalomicrobiaceae bacterium]|nr:NAD(P)H-hydrate dehydratase [Ancalomicrobiaceae bacterium]
MLELLSPAAMGRADRLAMEAGTPGIELMERAGRAVADAVAFRMALGRRVLVACGPGNNGGDGFIAARILKERGYLVDLMLLGELAALKGDAALAAGRWTGATLPLDLAGLARALGRAHIVVDALYGAGLARDLEGLPAATVAAINASGLPVIAVDLPSGIDGLTGRVRGIAIRAVASVTFFRRKPGHLLLPGRAHCGATTVADIGIPAFVLADIAVDAFANGPDLWGPAVQPPRLEDHKYARGHAVVVSGGLTGTGAARLGAMAALRAGAGLVTVASPPDALQVNASHLTAIMVRRMEGAAGLSALLADRRLNVLLIGPAAGVGPATVEAVLGALRLDPAEQGGAGRENAPRGFVLDADALTSFAADPGVLFAAIRASGGRVVMTPHEGEFSRLFPDLPVSGDQLSKPERARIAAGRSGAVVVLKGADTVVAAPDGRVAINDNAPADLATAGSGDVLAGIAAGLLARGIAAFEAAAAAVWMHGEAGRLAGPGLIAEDLAPQLPRVLADLYARGERAQALLDAAADEDDSLASGID